MKSPIFYVISMIYICNLDFFSLRFINIINKILKVTTNSICISKFVYVYRILRNKEFELILRQINVENDGEWFLFFWFQKEHDQIILFHWNYIYA